MKTLLEKILQRIFALLPVSKNKIMFVSYYGSQYGCSPKYLSEYIVRTHPEWDVVWAFTRPEKYDMAGVRKVKYMSLRYFYELSTSRIFVTNYRTTESYVKRRGQYYIMTWHSSLRLKMIERDAESQLPPRYKAMAKADSAKIDLLLSGCSFSDGIFRRAFWYDGEILPSGTPRNDMLCCAGCEEIAEGVRAKLNIDHGVKLLLYAPTFRENNDMSCYDLDFRALADHLSAAAGGEWKILVKLHPHLLSCSAKLLEGSGAVDVTAYDDIQELLLVSDMLVTDYSSLMFDFVLTRRPCFLYVPDLESYLERERNLYFGISDLPFPASRSQEELHRQISEMDMNGYLAAAEKFMKDTGSYEEGCASQRVTEYMQKWIA